MPTAEIETELDTERATLYLEIDDEDGEVSLAWNNIDTGDGDSVVLGRAGTSKTWYACPPHLRPALDDLENAWERRQREAVDNWAVQRWEHVLAIGPAGGW